MSIPSCCQYSWHDIFLRRIFFSAAIRWWLCTGMDWIQSDIVLLTKNIINGIVLLIWVNHFFNNSQSIVKLIRGASILLQFTGSDNFSRAYSYIIFAWSWHVLHFLEIVILIIFLFYYFCLLKLLIWLFFSVKCAVMHVIFL